MHTFRFKILWIISILLLFAAVSSCASFELQGKKQGQQGAEEAFTLIQREIEKKKNLPEEQFRDYMTMVKQGPVIPGLFQGFIPQGKAYLPEYDLAAISNYMAGDRAAALAIVSMKKGDIENVLWLHDKDGGLHRGHMGGIAVSGNHMWLASEEFFYKIPVENVINAPENSELSLGAPFSTEVRCSFATAFGGVVYIGEFRTRGRRYSTRASHTYKTRDGTRNHALMAGFVLDEQTGSIKPSMKSSQTAFPSFFISIPDKVQGAAFIGNYIILSQSYGRRNTSVLSVYRNPLLRGADNSFTLENGKEVPVWYLDGLNHVKSINAPPMTEGIANVNGDLAVLFESGSDKYRWSARFPQDRIQIMDISKITD